MARVKLSEFRAKSILVEGYEGYSLTFNNLDDELSRIPDGNYVLKVDQGIKKRGKQGLVAVNITPDQVRENANKWQNLGFSRYILEPLVPHEQSHEKYLAFQRTREGIIISFSELGGMDVEDNADSIKSFNELQISDLAKYSGISEEFIKNIIIKMNENHFSFLEINPLVIKDGQLILLDAAVLVDSAGEYFTNMWSENDIVEASQKTDAELRVRELDDNSPAALKLTVLNKDASLWLLLSGGGASITIADTIQAEGLGNQLGNYGEYSGGPTTEETYLYTKEILNLVLSSKAPKKAVIIAGGVANFTDVAKTFKGIIQALSEVAEELRQQKVKVFVRRGGPNEKEGLKNMEEFLRSNDLYGSVYGSDVVLTEAASEAIKYVGESK
ncbi:hypothetical protein KC960_04685 [Candidatus Saccharibacteria bacterium]|nr:hypothetical protein [Candidatus Saccharibacteria bacterium]